MPESWCWPMPEKNPLMNALRAIGSYATYHVDLPLFAELGLDRFQAAAHGIEIHVGVARFPAGSVQISVSCYPAQFWKLEVERDEPEAHIMLTTGSGSLTEYWPTVLLFLSDMMNVKEVSDA